MYKRTVIKPIFIIALVLSGLYFINSVYAGTPPATCPSGTRESGGYWENIGGTYRWVPTCVKIVPATTAKTPPKPKTEPLKPIYSIRSGNANDFKEFNRDAKGDPIGPDRAPALSFVFSINW